ncbi:hypothetical protein BO99DRAFT_219199 [Aspergillus violaceofuscus CBS 115571]|uniref:Uncharacterized protein n=1 Tax=Aspergillus violaceofuscus (strain CBS 115571) TaxID=1450538 RepID=A0A2V5HXB2_ASPV1|nr:hypothetical protein BO99DRAFT_219199 [Aspergillus violaceofuscus CBS 115571]
MRPVFDSRMMHSNFFFCFWSPRILLAFPYTHTLFWTPFKVKTMSKTKNPSELVTSYKDPALTEPSTKTDGEQKVSVLLGTHTN